MMGRCQHHFKKELDEHNKRHNKLVHKGQIPTLSEAEESFKAVEKFINTYNHFSISGGCV